MDIEKLKYEAQNKALHIADVSGSVLFNADCINILPLIPDKSVQLIVIDPPYFEVKGDFDFVFESEKQEANRPESFISGRLSSWIHAPVINKAGIEAI